MEQGPRTFLEIGAGMGERIIGQAKANPDKIYVVMDRDKPTDLNALPPNLTWFFGGITKNRKLLIPDDAIDEVDIDSVFRELYVKRIFKSSSLSILREAVRVVKENGVIYIREPKYMLAYLTPLLKEMNLNFEVSPIPLDAAKKHSVSIREAALEYESGDLNLEPYVLSVNKRSRVLSPPK